MEKTRQLLGFFLQTLSVRFFLQSTIFTLGFLTITTVLLNSLNLFSILSSNYSILSTFRIFIVLILGTFRTISTIDTILLLTISVLFGMNFTLVIQKINFIKRGKNLKITLGAGIVSLASAGCASCGLSIVSLIGIGSSLALLPFGGLELYFLSIVILTASFIYNLNAIYKACKI